MDNSTMCVKLYLNGHKCKNAALENGFCYNHRKYDYSDTTKIKTKKKDIYGRNRLSSIIQVVMVTHKTTKVFVKVNTKTKQIISKRYGHISFSIKEIVALSHSEYYFAGQKQHEEINYYFPELPNEIALQDTNDTIPDLCKNEIPVDVYDNIKDVMCEKTEMSDSFSDLENCNDEITSFDFF